MLTEAHFCNYKSIYDLTLRLGRVTVLIGENGCGKSNILEAFAFAAAAQSGRLDSEFLASRGIRLPAPRLMRSAFPDSEEQTALEFQIVAGTRQWNLNVENRGSGEYAEWVVSIPETLDLAGTMLRFVEDYYKLKPDNTEEERQRRLARIRQLLDKGLPTWTDFLIYSCENSALRTFEHEGQIQPLGIRGEGLFKLLKHLSREENKDRLDEIKENLRLIDWFGDLRIAPDLAPFERTLQIRDRYLADELAYFDQRSSNEGFLFLLFYFALFIAKETPSFFAIDNIDASLNPKLCSELMGRLVALAKKHDKQVIITTHNPAVLDGLDLHDEEQRLLVVFRDSNGHTKVRRVRPPEPVADEPPVRLSEAFLRGLVGGLPQNF